MLGFIWNKRIRSKNSSKKIYKKIYGKSWWSKSEDEKIKTYEEGNKNYENEIQRLKIKNYELFEQVTNNSQPAQSKQAGKQDDEDNEVSFSDIIDKIF